MTERIPATIVTGFLGAGKTTLIRNLIARAKGRRLAIIVNEFGDLGFDGGLIADCDDACRPDQIVELTNGCICCTVADEFLPAMEGLLARDPAPDHIVIETSGLALPQPLVRAFSWPAVRQRVTVDGVVTVVDATAIAEGRLAPRAAAADSLPEHDDPVEELFEDQLRCADLIVVSKSDLVDEAGLASVEEIVRREARVGTATLRSATGGVRPEVLLGLAAATEANMAGRESHHDREGEEHDHDDFESHVIRPFPFASLDDVKARVAAALGVPGVLRIKGRAGVAGRAATAIVQAVGPRVETWFSPGETEPSLVVIGLSGFDRNAVEARLSG